MINRRHGRSTLIGGRLVAVCLLSLLAAAVTSTNASAAPPRSLLATVDFPGATWVPAATSNYTVANRPLDYPVDMIVIHDIEGSYASAIKIFQDPNRHGSAHYVIGYHGQVTQMVSEHDVAWHAGNWDYNTRAIGIEHEGFASSNLYTLPEYRRSAQLAASIYSRCGVPMDRKHVIGHSQVPDPNHPGLFGGSDHHTDPGPYWNWTYYMSIAQYYASLLSSPPHMVPPTAYSGDGTATVQWPAARTCHNSIDSYVVVAQPGGMEQTLPGTARSASFAGLTNGVNYSFTVTAHNSDGEDGLTSNTVIPGPSCSGATLSASPASPQPTGGAVLFTASSNVCANPQYQFSVQDSTGNWVIQQPFGRNSWTWDSYASGAGVHNIRVQASHGTADPSLPEDSAQLTYTLSPFSFTDWHAVYDMSKAPTSWVAGRSQTFPVTVTNSGDVTWPAAGYYRVDLILHFAAVGGGGSATRSKWLNIKAFSMPSNLAPGASVTLSVTIAAPSTTGSLVLEAQMLKERQFWFPQWQPVGVNVAARDKTAVYDMSKAPTSWLAGQSQTFQVTVTNTSTYTWLSTGYYRTDLDLHFTPVAGGAARQSAWLTNQAFSLPANLAPGGKLTLNVTVTAPSKTGPLVLEALMVKEHQFWFQQWAPVNVTVAAAAWSAGYNLAGAPATWTKGQTQSVTATVTNTGNIAWPSSGYYRVDLEFHFTTRTGGAVKLAYWLTNQAYSLPADLAPGNSVTLTVSVTAPASAGSMYLEAEMVKEHQFWFAQIASIPVTVS